MARIGIDIRNIGKQRTGDEVVFFNLVKALRIIPPQRDPAKAVANSYEYTNKSKNIFYLFTDIADVNKIEEIRRDLEIENSDDFKIISLKSANKFTWNLWTLPRYLRKNPVDVYHTQYITPFFVPRKIKIVTTIHDISFNFFPKYIKWTDLFFLKTLIPISLWRADKVIAVSEFTRGELMKYYKVDRAKADCVHNAVSEDYFEKEITSQNLQAVRKKYDLPEKFILYVGTLQPRKNLTALIEAYAKIKNEIPRLKLVLGGKRSARNFDKRIDKAIKKYSLDSDVIFPGFIAEADKKAVFAAAEMFCFPSLYEGFGIPVLEAMAAGIPAIASNIPAHREVAGEAALFFSPENAGELSGKIIEIFKNKDLRNELIEKGKAQCRKFTWKESAQKTLSVYEELLS
jgi:glycosyltransferase involved in cell wall biosynthesis